MSELTCAYLDESLQVLDDKFEQRLNNSLQKLDEKFEQRLDDSLQKLDENFNWRFELQRQSIEGMLASFGKMIVDVLDKKTMDLDNRMEAGFTELRTDMDDVKKRLDKLQTDMDMAKIRIYDVENELRSMRQV
jgi:ABC-type uncharacterized transport system ATPase component